MKPLRSWLFVPGHRGTWVEKGVASGADALILDLEDSVPDDLKAPARQEVAASVRRLRGTSPEIGVYVRLNSLESGMAGDDLEVVAVDGVDGFLLPKVYGADDVIRFGALVDHFERRNGVAPDTVHLVPDLETAGAYAECEKIARVPRVATLFAGTARDADVSRSIGFQFTPGGLETLYLRGRAVLACRAAGLEWPIVGLWQDLTDPEGELAFARQNRELGYRGQVAIHPKAIPVINEVYTPAASELEFYAGMVEAFEAAVARGAAAVSYEGMHVDYAHVRTAREVLELGRRFAEQSAEPETVPAR